MENTIKETTRLLLQGNLTKSEADKILLDLHIVSQRSELLPTKKETEVEIERELKELKLNVRESYLKNTMLKGFEIGFQKCFNWIKTR